MIKFLPLDFLGVSHRILWKNDSAVYRLQIPILVASSSIIFIQVHVVCLTFEILFKTILHFLTSEAHFSAL